MARELVINVTDSETRIALLESGALAEFHVEYARKLGVVGNVYKGKVIRVLPGMQAAFVEIGLERAAFLYVADVRGHREESAALDETGDVDDTEETIEDELESEDAGGLPIEELLREGQDLMVQVMKEPLGTKGARLSSHISLPGRFLVLMPTMRHVGVSRRIEDEDERRRLKDMIEGFRSDKDYGFIVRTVAEGADDRTLKADYDFLVRLWEQVQDKYRACRAPSLVHTDLSITLRAIRDLMTADVERVVIDNAEEHEQIIGRFGETLPGLEAKIELYQGEEPIFDRYNLEMEISRALQRKVWLKSGGYIVIEQTEALTSIDVNTGRFVGKRNFEETILKTNLEAVKEIGYQLRLRNIGGIIVIDFIDMEKEPNREKVRGALIEELRNDKARTNVLQFSELGLVEMTRKRTRENLVRLLSEPCPYCEGRGFVKNRSTIGSEIFRAIRREARTAPSASITVDVHPTIASMLLESEQHTIGEIESMIARQIVIRENASFHIEQYEIHTG
ncbi:Rne/Rng family ribonuclease [bacterium]|nr:Rne/Rng family ribonuclease [bacterium]